MKKLLALALLTIPASAQVQLGGHVYVPSTSDSTNGQTNVVFTADANCTVSSATNCTVTGVSDPGGSSKLYTGTINVTATATLTAQRDLVLVMQPGGGRDVINSASQPLNVTMTAGTVMCVVPAAASGKPGALHVAANGSVFTCTSSTMTAVQITAALTADPTSTIPASATNFQAPTIGLMPTTNLLVYAPAICEMYANSIGRGLGSSNPTTKSAFALSAAAAGCTTTYNYAIDGQWQSDINELETWQYAKPAVNDHTARMQYGATNDAGQGNNEANYRIAHIGGTAYLSSVAVEAASVAPQTGWTVDTTYPMQHGLVSTTPGAAITVTLTAPRDNPYLVVYYQVKQGNTGSFRVQTNTGVLVDTNTYLPTGSIYGATVTQFPGGLITQVPVTGGSTYTLTITNLSASSASSNQVMILGWTQGHKFDTNGAAGTPQLWDWSLSQAQANGADSVPGSTIAFQNFNDYQAEDDFILQQAGFGVNWVDVGNCFTTLPAVVADGLHPNDAGYAQIAKCVEGPTYVLDYQPKTVTLNGTVVRLGGSATLPIAWANRQISSTPTAPYTCTTSYLVIQNGSSNIDINAGSNCTPGQHMNVSVIGSGTGPVNVNTAVGTVPLYAGGGGVFHYYNSNSIIADGYPPVINGINCSLSGGCDLSTVFLTKNNPTATGTPNFPAMTLAGNTGITGQANINGTSVTVNGGTYSIPFTCTGYPCPNGNQTNAPFTTKLATLLTADLSSTATTLTVASTAGFPAAGNIGGIHDSGCDEFLSYDSIIDSTHFHLDHRGVYGTTACAHTVANGAAFFGITTSFGNSVTTSPSFAITNLSGLIVSCPSVTAPGAAQFCTAIVAPAATIGAATIGSAAITGNVRTNTTSNTDFAGILTLSGGSATYNFTTTWTSTPVCVANDNSAVAAVRAVPSTTSVVFTGSGTDTINYICVGRTQ